MDRLIVIISDTSYDVTTHQRVPNITLHCHRDIVGYWKLGGRSEVLYIWQFTALIWKSMLVITVEFLDELLTEVQ